MLKERFIADRKVLQTNHSFKACFIPNVDLFCRLSREAFAKGLRNIWKGFVKRLKGFEKRLKSFANRLTGVSKGFEKCLKYFPSVCKEFA